MTKLPPEVLRALRLDQPDAIRPEHFERLAASIEAAAAPLLAERRRAEQAWWDLPARWASALIPISLALAAASILVLWRVEPLPERQVAQAAVDQAVNELVTTPPR